MFKSYQLFSSQFYEGRKTLKGWEEGGYVGKWENLANGTDPACFQPLFGLQTVKMHPGKDGFWYQKQDRMGEPKSRGMKLTQEVGLCRKRKPLPENPSGRIIM